MSNNAYTRIVRDGLWDNNGVFSMLLGMCPTMAMTTSATNGFGMGLATAAVMAASSLLVATFRNHISQEVRIPVFILIVATMVTLVDLAMNAWMHELYKVLGLFIPLIVSNCLPLARLEAFAAKAPIVPAFVDGLCMGLGFTIALTAPLARCARSSARERFSRMPPCFSDRPSSSWNCVCCRPAWAC
jgi:electron transport complex protein RnfE